VPSLFLSRHRVTKFLERGLKKGNGNRRENTKRLETAKRELKFIPEFEYLIINEDLEESIRNLMSIIYAEKIKV